jgi:hypothetical protein
MHVEMLAGVGEIDACGHARGRLREALHGGDLAIDPGVKRWTKSRTARALTPTGTTISTRPPTCTRAVSRRARALTRTANASPELRVSNSDSCVPCAFIATMIPGSTRAAVAPG